MTNYFATLLPEFTLFGRPFWEIRHREVYVLEVSYMFVQLYVLTGVVRIVAVRNMALLLSAAKIFAGTFSRHRRTYSNKSKLAEL